MTTGVNTNNTTNTSGTGSTSTAMQQLSGNMNTFLTLLTTQLQNQDPLSPMDSTQFTQQLVEYSQVEQQINTNSNLQNLISLQQAGAGAAAVGYLGKNVTVTNGNAALTNGSATWNYNLPAAAATTTLTVTDATGKTVYTGSGQRHPARTRSHGMDRTITAISWPTELTHSPSNRPTPTATRLRRP